MKSFAVIGVGRFGRSVATTLYSLGCEVLVIDRNEEVIQSIADEVTHAITVKTLDEAVMKSLGMRNFDAAIVAIGDELESSVLVALMLKEIGVKYVIAKATGELHAKVLSKIGVDKIIQPEHDMGERVANQLVNTHVIDLIELSPEYSIAEVMPPCQWVGRSLQELDLRVKHKINVIAVKKDAEVNISPGPEYVIQQDDELAVVGSINTIKALLRDRA